jgi:hypothetical protein
LSINIDLDERFIKDRGLMILMIKSKKTRREKLEPLSDSEKKEWSDWYSNVAVKFEIVKALQNRELSALGFIDRRWLVPYKVSFLDEIMRYLKIKEQRQNIYRSLEKYDRIMSMSFENEQRIIDMAKWKKERASHVIGVDFGIDLDNKPYDYDTLFGDADKIKSLLDKYDVIYSFWVSGRGFHFIIPFEALPDEIQSYDKKDLINMYFTIADEILSGIRSEDMSIYTPTRVLKYPFTIAKNGRVILPLDDNEYELLKEGKLSLCPSDVLREREIRGRGIFFRGTREGTKKFFDEMQEDMIP